MRSPDLERESSNTASHRTSHSGDFSFRSVRKSMFEPIIGTCCEKLKTRRKGSNGSDRSTRSTTNTRSKRSNRSEFDLDVYSTYSLYSSCIAMARSGNRPQHVVFAQLHRGTLWSGDDYRLTAHLAFPLLSGKL